MKNILEIIDNEIEESRKNISDDTILFVNIDSTMGEPVEGGPFGKGPKKMLDTVIEKGKNDGFYTKDYGVGVASVALNEGEPDLGIWLHGDVVPVGDGWKYSPFDAVEIEGCIIGRGAADNKGQLAAMYNLLKIFKKLGIELNYNLAVYVGSNEESGVKDILGDSNNHGALGFLNVAKAPRLSLIADGGFPVGYAGKGKATFRLRSKTRFKKFIFSAGQKETPWKAFAYFEKDELVPNEIPECTVEKGEKICIWTESCARHGSSPDPNGNMITKLSKALLDLSLVPEENRTVIEAFKELTLDTNGDALGINKPHKDMGSPRVFVSNIDFLNGYPELEVSVRFPIGVTYEDMRKKIADYGEKNGLELVDSFLVANPYVRDEKSNVVKLLAEVSNTFIGTDAKPYVIGGLAYSHVLPNAYLFGCSSNLAPKSFPEGRGGVHGLDESVSIDCLVRSMKIYARALLKLQEIEW